MTCIESISDARSFNPWVYVTYDCTCKCPYCMIPDMTCAGEKAMSPENFRKMLEITERLFEKGVYDQAHFRLSGGEPSLAFDNFKNIVTEYRQKYPSKMGFGILTNLTLFTDEIADWMEENSIGVQVSIDDLVNGKPLANGKSSSELVLANIQKLQTRNINFSFNTVLDIEKTQDLTRLANFVSSFNNIEWGLNASYTERDAKVNQVIKIFDACIFQLVKRGFDINHKLRFYNTTIGLGRGGCTAGIDSFAIGTNLELWPCQSWCDRESIGYFDENIKETLKTAPGNEFFRTDKRYLPRCLDCPVYSMCHGGCRATHESDEINDAVCQIRKDILTKLALGHYTKNQQCGCNSNRQCNQCQQCQQCNNACNNQACTESSECHDHVDGLNTILDDYVSKLPDKKGAMLVDTPDLE